MLDRSLRVYKEQMLRPVANGLMANIHPTTLTLIGFGFGIGAGLAAWQGMVIWSMALWALNRLFDGLDGTVARRYNKQTDLGGYIDILLDDAIYVFIIAMLAVGVNTAPAYIAALFLLASYRVNSASWMYLSSLMEKRKQGASANSELTSITMPPGLIEGTETVVFYFAFLAFPAYATPLFALFGALVFFTVGQRVLWAVRNL